MGVTAAPTVTVLITIVLRAVRVREAIKGVGDIGARNSSTLRDHVLKRVEAIKYYIKALQKQVRDPRQYGVTA